MTFSERRCLGMYSLCVNMDRYIRVFLSNRANKHGCSFGFEHTSHIFNADDVRPNLHNLCHQIQVIFQVILLMWI